MTDVLQVIVFLLGILVVFPAFWSSVVWLIGFNWRGLARDYPAERWPEDGHEVTWQSASLGMSNYSSVLTFVAAEEGLYIRPLWMYRAGHPPVCIPWTEVEAVEPGALFGTRLRLANGRTLTVRKRLGEAIGAAIEAHGDTGLTVLFDAEAEGDQTESGDLPEEAAVDQETRPVRTGGRRRA
ncbi:MAG: hypothetical protein AAGI52_16915 [Bacteroidota bacterium]